MFVFVPQPRGWPLSYAKDAAKSQEKLHDARIPITTPMTLQLWSFQQFAHAAAKPLEKRRDVHIQTITPMTFGLSKTILVVDSNIDPHNKRINFDSLNARELSASLGLERRLYVILIKIREWVGVGPS